MPASGAVTCVTVPVAWLAWTSSFLCELWPKLYPGVYLVTNRTNGGADLVYAAPWGFVQSELAINLIAAHARPVRAGGLKSL